MNPYFRPTAAPAPALAPRAYPAGSGPFQPTAASAGAGAANHGQKTAPPQAVSLTYPPTRRAAPPIAHADAATRPSSSSINPAAAPAAPPSSSKPPGPYPSGTGPAAAAGVGPVRTKYKPWDGSDWIVAERPPLDLFHPAAGCVRYYPADRHKPKPPPVYHPTLSSEHRRLSAAAKPAKPNTAPVDHPTLSSEHRRLSTAAKPNSPPVYHPTLSSEHRRLSAAAKPNPPPDYHPTISSEYRRLSAAAKSNNDVIHPNRPPPIKGPTYPIARPYNPYLSSSSKPAPKPEPAPDADPDESYERGAPWLRPGATFPIIPPSSRRFR